MHIARRTPLTRSVTKLRTSQKGRELTAVLNRPEPIAPCGINPRLLQATRLNGPQYKMNAIFTNNNLNGTVQPPWVVGQQLRLGVDEHERTETINPFANLLDSLKPSGCLPEVTPVLSHHDGVRQRFEAYASEERERALFVSDVGVVERQLARWHKNLPDVLPFYAVKCNPDPVMLNNLAKSGTNFDCASGSEIRSILEMGVDPSRIVFANPVKNPKDLAYAYEVGVQKMTFDNEEELDKIKALCPNAHLILRLLPDDSGSVMRFGSKFGACAESVEDLFVGCIKRDLKVVGVSFHIGSGCFDALKYDSAIALCRDAFDTAETLGMPPLYLVDIGGGFPGTIEAEEDKATSTSPVTTPANATPQPPSFETIAVVIRRAFDKYLPSDKYPDLLQIGEPGRYFATAFSALFLRIQGRRRVRDDSVNRFLYYVNDGVYGSFNCKMFDYYHPNPVPVEQFFHPSEETTSASPKSVATSPSTFFGPTCDSLDKIVEDHPIRELQIGEYVAFENMGAYTSSAATEFNGCRLAVKQYIHSLH